MSERPQETARDDTTVRIGQAVMLHRAGDREEARNRLAQLWAETADGGDPFHRCTIAHYMADTQDDPVDELAWDQRALAAADAVTDEQVHWGEHALAVRSLYPSLHLNLAAGHAKLGEESAALRALARARDTCGQLPDDAYGAGIRAGIEELSAQLGGSGGSGGARPGAAEAD